MKNKENKILYFIIFLLSVAVAGLIISNSRTQEMVNLQELSSVDQIQFDVVSKGLFSPLSILGSEFSALSAVSALPEIPNNIDSDYSDTPDITNNIILEIQKSEESDTPKPLELLSSGPQVLIYHTHTTESYRQAYDGEYKESSKWRTNNNDKNITAVGEALKNELLKYEITSMHDYTNHEPPKLGTAYVRSLRTMEKYQKDYPSIQLYIDVHRDAADVETAKNDVVIIDGKRCARVMFVVGAGTDPSFANSKKPNYKSNYQLAQNISASLNSIDPKFTRPIRVKPGRYNQHISDSCLLIEIGHNANTLEEALNSVPYIAKAISQCVQVKTSDI